MLLRRFWHRNTTMSKMKRKKLHNIIDYTNDRSKNIHEMYGITAFASYDDDDDGICRQYPKDAWQHR